MTFELDVRSVLGSSLLNRVASRPRLLASLAFLLLLLAVQGGAAGEAAVEVGTQDNEMGTVGP